MESPTAFGFSSFLAVTDGGGDDGGHAATIAQAETIAQRALIGQQIVEVGAVLQERDGAGREDCGYLNLNTNENHRFVIEEHKGQSSVTTSLFSRG